MKADQDKHGEKKRSRLGTQSELLRAKGQGHAAAGAKWQVACRAQPLGLGTADGGVPWGGEEQGGAVHTPSDSRGVGTVLACVTDTKPGSYLCGANGRLRESGLDSNA